MGIRLSERNALTRGKASFPYTRGKHCCGERRKRGGFIRRRWHHLTPSPPPTTPHSSTFTFPLQPSCSLPLPCLAFSLAGWLFVCLGSLACRCVVCLCVSSSSCSVGVVVLFSGLFSLCPVSWFSVFLLSFCVYVHVSVFLVSWLCVLYVSVSCLCGVCFISVSAVYGVCVFGWCVCVVSLLFSRVSPVSMCLVGALSVAYCLLSIGLLSVVLLCLVCCVLSLLF